MPRVRSTASVSKPTGPPPVMRTRSSGCAPERLTVCNAIAVGSVSAAARTGSSGRDREQSGRVDDDELRERAAEVEMVGWRPAQAHRRSPAQARAALAAAGRRVGDDTGPDERRRRHRRRRRRRCPTTRDRAPNPAARTSRARGAGRCRRSRSARSRRVLHRPPGAGRESPGLRSVRPRCRPRPACRSSRHMVRVILRRRLASAGGWARA